MLAPEKGQYVYVQYHCRSGVKKYNVLFGSELTGNIEYYSLDI